MLTKPEIYTQDFVLQELQGFLTELTENPEIIFKGELFLSKDYSYQRFSEWATKYKENKEIMDTIGKINEILESRAVVGGLTSKYNPTITKFHLINNYDWRDKSETDITTKGKEIGSINFPVKNE